MKASRVVLGLVVSLTVTACGSAPGDGATTTSSLPVGSTRWDVGAPAWLHDGVLHVGDREVTLGPDVDEYVLGATGAYWLRGRALMFTSADDRTQRATPGRWSNLAVSADRTVVAAVDESRGPTDQYGTHVLQAAAFDTRDGRQLYRTPDREPDDGDDLADLYEETTPLLQGVSDRRLFFDDTTIDLADGSSEPTYEAGDGTQAYAGFAETLFVDGFHVGLDGDGSRRELSATEVNPAVGRLSPDRSTIFDVGTWPSPAVVYDARTGRRSPIDAPWGHFSLTGFGDDGTFHGVAQRIDEDSVDNVLRAQQVVSCRLRTLTCTPVSPVFRTDDDDPDGSPSLVMETDDGLF